MKALLITSTCLVLFITADSMGRNTQPENDDKKKFEHPVLDLKLLESYYLAEDVEIAEITYKFYDINDRLLFSTTLKENEEKDGKLLSLVSQSELLTDYENALYYRLEE